MPAAIPPLLMVSVRYGAVALAAYGLARRSGKAPRDFRAEDAMDDTTEGVSLRTDKGQGYGSFRWKRLIRWGARGPGVEIDATTIFRAKVRKVDKDET